MIQERGYLDFSVL